MSRHLYTVPAGTKPVKCRRCQMTAYWVHVNGQPKLIDCSAIGGVEPSEAHDPKQLGMFGEAEIRDGKGVNHFDDCAPLRED